jgi:hypothetical protein
MSESGHSQPGLYGIERRRRWKEPGSSGPQNLSGPGGRERDYIAPWERERRVSAGFQFSGAPPTSSTRFHPGAVDMSVSKAALGRQEGE